MKNDIVPSLVGILLRIMSIQPVRLGQIDCVWVFLEFFPIRLMPAVTSLEPVPLGQITEEHFDKTFDLNVRGTLFTVQKALPLFNDGGSILMTGSNAAAKGFPGFGVYAASKLALRSFARTWLNELKERKIRVNLLVPGAIATTMQEAVLTPDAKKYFESLIPRGSMGQPDEVATVALFLASNDSSFVNGQELFVDGGMTAI